MSDEQEKTNYMPDPSWKNLYQITAVTCAIGVLLIICAVIAYLIWPYSPGFESTEETLLKIKANLFGGLMSLDLILLIGTLLSIPAIIGLYVALKNINKSYALIALVLGLISVSSLIPSRPIMEIVGLSENYAVAHSTYDIERSLIVSEALLSLFNGTAWAIYYILTPISSLISCCLMLQCRVFKKSFVYLGIGTNGIAIISFIFLSIPEIGMILALLTMPGYIIWNIYICKKFFNLGWPERR